ncbi:hypothetical protein V1512DRAFT_257673 [Lipomyces arxii]|uniref:uncharacterized protein n=1 Tax=Lipomyces arxii TaxID=56418 RepID=UPI0034CEADDC
MKNNCIMYRSLITSVRFRSKIFYKQFSAYTIRNQSTYYTLFPDTLRDGPPPKGAFDLNARELRREFLRLQSKTHPDLARTEEDRVLYESASSELNKAYSTLVSPLSRALYLLDLGGHGISEETGRTMPQDLTLLMEVYELLERIEEAETEEQVLDIKKEVENRIRETETAVASAFNSNSIIEARKATVVLKYWVNVRDALKEWEPGQEFRMVH